MMPQSALALGCLVVLICSAGPRLAAAETRDYAWFLRQVVDLGRLASADEGVTSRQFSSYNRASRFDRTRNECVGMDANGDAGPCLSVLSGPQAAADIAALRLPPEAAAVPFGDLEWVLDPVERNQVVFRPRAGIEAPQTVPPENLVAAMAGPGCIVRLWSADPRGKIRLYLDGSTTPIEWDFRALFAGGVAAPDQAALERRAEWPFIAPLTFRRGGEQDQLASDCYLPIPYATSCLVALTSPSFYHIGYKSYPAGTPVESFRLPLTSAAVAALDAVSAVLLGRGGDPKPPQPGLEILAQTVELAPGQEVVLADLQGPRTITAIHAKLTGHERYASSKVLLTGFFDAEKEPCIWAPLVNFFGTGFEPRDYRSLPLGYVEGEGYCYLPMPFHQRGRLVVRHEGTRPATLAYRVVHAPTPDLPADAMLFKCKYRREEASRTFDYPLLRCEGRGRFVGAALCIDDAWRSWWGEGDEKIWVDDDLFPSFFGTGSEDFFGDAWGIRTLHEPFFACSLFDTTPEHSWTCCYRWMIPDDVPFARRFAATIENYPESQWGPAGVEWDEDYVSVAYWYQAPGGSDFFAPVAVAQRRPWGKVPKPPVLEAEEAFQAHLGLGGRVVNDEDLPYEFSRGLAVDLGEVAAGAEFRFAGPDLLVEGPYALSADLSPDLGHPASFSIWRDGQEIARTPAGLSQGGEVALGAVVLPRGRTELVLRFTSAGRAVIDCLRFAAARQLQDVVEAERATIVSAVGVTPAEEQGVLWSGGRQMCFAAAEVGAAVELDIVLPPGRWSVRVGLSRGAAYGDWEASVNGTAGTVLRGFAPTPDVRDHVALAAVQSTGAAVRCRFVCVGRNQAATGFALGLDYVSWRPILVENAIEGETADIVDIRDGQRTDQLLGPGFSGGNHLWFHPSKAGASFTWLLEAPAEGAYALAAYFTKSWDYAIVRLSLDGKALGEFDTYDPQVVWGGETKLGTHTLTRGTHRLTFEAIGHSERSKGILIGVDCLTLEPLQR